MTQSLRCSKLDSNERFIECQAFLRPYDLAPCLPPYFSLISKLSFFISLPVCRRLSLLPSEGGIGGRGAKLLDRPLKITQLFSVVNYGTPWFCEYDFQNSSFVQVAAQNCRKRKIDQIKQLETEVTRIKCRHAFHSLKNVSFYFCSFIRSYLPVHFAIYKCIELLSWAYEFHLHEFVINYGKNRNCTNVPAFQFWTKGFEIPLFN